MELRSFTVCRKARFCHQTSTRKESRISRDLSAILKIQKVAKSRFRLSLYFFYFFFEKTIAVITSYNNHRLLLYIARIIKYFVHTRNKYRDDISASPSCRATPHSRYRPPEHGGLQTPEANIIWRALQATYGRNKPLLLQLFLHWHLIRVTRESQRALLVLCKVILESASRPNWSS